MKNLTLPLSLCSLLTAVTLNAHPSWLTSLFSTKISSLSASLVAKYNEPIYKKENADNSSNSYYTKGNVAVAACVGIGGIGVIGYLWHKARTHKQKNSPNAHKLTSQHNTPLSAQPLVAAQLATQPQSP